MTPPDAGRVEEIRERHEQFEKDIAGRNLRGWGSNWLTDGGLTAHADRAILLAALTPTPPPTEPEGELVSELDKMIVNHDEGCGCDGNNCEWFGITSIRKIAALARARGK